MDVGAVCNREIVSSVRRFGLASLGGAVYGLALARYLFESNPHGLGVFGTWPVAIGLALFVSGTVVAFTRWLRLPAPAALALFLPLLNLLAPDINLLRAQTLLGGSLILFGLLTRVKEKEREKEKDSHYWPLFLFLSLFLLYLRTLAPAVGEADTFEFQVGIARLGIAHGSGYPLLMLVGKFFTLLPVGGTMAFRANLTSACFGALAALGVERLARKLGTSPLAALLAGLAFGVSPTLWSRAVEVEAYTLNAALVVGILYLCVHLIQSPDFVIRDAYWLAFLFGLSLTNHLTTLLLAPACLLALLYALRTTPSALSRSIPLGRFTFYVSLLTLFLLGLSLYLYLFIRWPAVNHGELLSWAQFANILSGNEAKGAFQWTLPFTDLGRYAIVGRKIVGEYGWPSLALALLGGLSLLRRSLTHYAFHNSPPQKRFSFGEEPGVGSVFALAYSGYLYFALAFNVPDPDFSAFFIPLHLIASVLMSLGLTALLRLRASFTFHSLLFTLFSLLPLASLWLTLPRVDQSHDWAKQKLGEYILAQPLAPNAAILADSERIAPLYYLQVAEQIRPDLDIIVLPDEASYRAVLDERVAAGQTVYLARYLPGLGSGYSLRSIGPLAEVSPIPFSDATQFTSPLSATLAHDIHLLGYAADTLTLAAPDSLRLTLYWQAAKVVNENLLVNLRLVTEAGVIAWQSTGRVPVSDLYPTNAWRTDEIISDFYNVPLDASLPPGQYQLHVGLFPPFQVVDEGWADIAAITVLSPNITPTPTHPLRAKFGSLWLIGYDAPESAAPGSRVNVILYWLRSAGNDSVTALGETRSLAAWPVGAIAPMAYALTAPASGPMPIHIATGQPAQCGWFRPLTESCPLPAITLTDEGTAEGAINFDHQLLLRTISIDTPNAVPGGLAEVTLEWQGLQAMSENYTVFVHLLGPDGVVYGQVDAWPVSGTRATSGWKPGEVIADHYSIRLDADAPLGEYQVEVGLYLLATLERLPVLNAEGAPIDDKALVPGLSVKN